jgi:GTP-binding protein
LGVVVLDATTEFVLADIPGLIEGASEGKGLGHEFLRHIERTRVLIHLLDGLSESPLTDLAAINAELAAFGHGLAEKPQLVVLNKVDEPAAQARWPEVEETLKKQGHSPMAISALARQGTRDVLLRAAQMLAELPEESPIEILPVFRPEEVDMDTFTVEREEEDVWRVRGGRVERLAARTIWNLDEAVYRFQRALDGMGITEALEEAGVEPGDTVKIGDHELVWEE